ncbi:hypothetical protein [Demequina lutea]|uniref:hypothetical protein n=1 Tax=Demequina lutea TaxID=431489 RepID=UPI0015C73428|nr:hypothetical protein [Demequina lutea]
MSVRGRRGRRGRPGLAATVAHEAGHRRSIAVISHPGAGKSTLTEPLALHAHAIDRFAIERTRRISITAAA